MLNPIGQVLSPYYAIVVVELEVEVELEVDELVDVEVLVELLDELLELVELEVVEVAN